VTPRIISRRKPPKEGSYFMSINAWPNIPLYSTYQTLAYLFPPDSNAAFLYIGYPSALRNGSSSLFWTLASLLHTVTPGTCFDAFCPVIHVPPGICHVHCDFCLSVSGPFALCQKSIAQTRTKPLARLRTACAFFRRDAAGSFSGSPSIVHHLQKS